MHKQQKRIRDIIAQVPMNLEKLRTDMCGPNPHSLLIIGDFNVKFGKLSFDNIKTSKELTINKRINGYFGTTFKVSPTDH